MPQTISIAREFTFDAAHHLMGFHGKCELPHGHTYRVQITVSGPIGKDGLVVDFHELKKVVHERIIDMLDHSDLNDLFPNPSAENIVIWIWERLSDVGHVCKRDVRLTRIKLWEGEKNFVIYEGN